MTNNKIAAVFTDIGTPANTVKILNAPGNPGSSDRLVGMLLLQETPMGPTGINTAYYPVLRDDDFRNLEGKVLTVADAIFTDEKQAEAVKALFRSEMRRWFSDCVSELESHVSNAKLVDYNNDLKGRFDKENSKLSND